MSMCKQASKTARRIAYARVSTDKQTTDQQVVALNAAGCDLVFIDEGVSATARKRPGLQKAKKTLRRGDVFVVWAIDRAFRSTFEAIAFLDDLSSKGIAFQSLTQQIDPRTPEGRKWFIDTASWAEYERAIISRRTKEKMALAKERGMHLGPPFKLSKRRVKHAHTLIHVRGVDVDAVAHRYDVAPITILRAFKRYGLEAA